MSKSLHKQTSQGTVGYQRQNSGGASTHTPKVLHRSNTVVERSANSAGPKRPREPSSPLKRFAKAKESISKAFSHICEQLVETRGFLQRAHGGEEPTQVTSLLGRTQGIVDILSRDHMKVAFFGRTSNGKSSVINALLGSKVLPAGIGHTTNCFCSVIGADTEEGYLLSPGSAEKQNVKNVQQLAHSLHKKHLAHSSLVQVFWPKSKCPLLRDDVEFVDSPGIDMNPDMDEWINRHCLDADVFVLVSNAESTLMNAEKSFFHRVSERLSKPNIFILNNRWDASAQEPELMEEVKGQHLERDLGFLTHELRVTDEPTARNRVFFVSAKEVLHYRIRQQQNVPDPGAGLEDGYKVRLMEFEQFERQFKECISDAAIRTKFEQHHKQGEAVVTELGSLLTEEEQSLQQHSVEVDSQLRHSMQRESDLQFQSSRIKDQCKQGIGAATKEVEEKIAVAMRDVVAHMPSLVDQHQAGFDSAHVETYKHGLYEFMDASLAAELSRISDTCLSGLHEKAQKGVIDTYQQLLQLPADELSRVSQLVQLPELSCVLDCEDLCKDFHEDLEFRFTLLGAYTMLNKLNLGSILGSARGHASDLWRLIPMDYALPLLAILVGTMLPRIPTLRVVVPVVGLYFGIYAYEKLMWTERSKEAALKRQFVDHMREKVQLQVRATNQSYTRTVSSSLSQLQQRLHTALETSRDEERKRIAQLGDEQTELSQLKDQARTLRNAVQLVGRDLEDFSEEYLDPTT